MKINKILSILTFFLLLGCGFEPMYSEKKIDSNYNFTIESIGFSGNNSINQYLKNNLLSYTNKKNKEIKYDLVIDSSFVKTITSKNKKGNPEIFAIEITIYLEIYKAESLINQNTLKENFEYKNKSSRFELKQYEESIKENLTSKLSRDIIERLYSIK